MQRKFALRSKPLQICAAEYLRVNLVDCPMPQTWTLGLWWCTYVFGLVGKWTDSCLCSLWRIRFWEIFLLVAVFRWLPAKWCRRRKRRIHASTAATVPKGGILHLYVQLIIQFCSVLWLLHIVTLQLKMLQWWVGNAKSLPCLGKAATCARVAQLDLLWLYCNAFCLGYLKDVTSRDSSVVRAPDLWLKGHGFESLQEQWENFLLQGYLSVLTLISGSVPPPCYHNSM